MGNRWASDFTVLLFRYGSTFFIFSLAAFPDLFPTSPRAGFQYLVRDLMKCIIYVTPNGTICESERVWTEVVVTCFRSNYLGIYTETLIKSMKKSWLRRPGCGSIESESPEKGGLQRQEVMDGETNSMACRDTSFPSLAVSELTLVPPQSAIHFGCLSLVF